jgi:hypothetical protein
VYSVIQQTFFLLEDTAPMNLNPNRIFQTMAGTAMAFALIAGAQTPPAPAPAATPAATPPAAAPAPAADQAPAAPAAPAAPTWSVGPMDVSGFIDGYYSVNFNRPTATNNGQVNDLYNFDDKTDQFSLSAAKLTLNHDPDPVGAHVDFIYGRTNDLINAPTANSSSADQLNYIEQAFLSLKPPKAKGFELDFGKFVTSAGAEVIEAKDNWNYSRSLLFAWAIPYWHFGARTSVPVSKVDTIGVQVVNGWNNVAKSNGGVTVGLTNVLTKPKYTWSLNYYVGPENANTSSGMRNILNTWQGGAVAFHEQATGKTAFSGRYEYFDDANGYETGTAQQVQEFTATYEYKWVEGLLTRVEYRGDFSNVAVFHKDQASLVDQQQTLTIGFIAFFGPKR